MAVHLSLERFRNWADERLNFDTERPLAPPFQADHARPTSFASVLYIFPTIHRATLIQYIPYDFSPLAASIKTAFIPRSDLYMRIPLQLAHNPCPVGDITRKQPLFDRKQPNR